MPYGKNKINDERYSIVVQGKEGVWLAHARMSSVTKASVYYSNPRDEDCYNIHARCNLLDINDIKFSQGIQFFSFSCGIQEFLKEHAPSLKQRRPRRC